MKARKTPLTTSRVSTARPQLRPIYLQNPLMRHTLMHSIVRFAPAADICFSTSHQLVCTMNAVCHLQGAAFCLPAPRPSFACTRLSPALAFRLRSPPACTRLPPHPHGSAFISSSPHEKTHLTASKKHNNQLGAISPLTPRRHPRRHAVLPTPRRVCGGDSHLSGASQLTSLHSRQPGAGFLRIFPLTAACFR